MAFDGDVPADAGLPASGASNPYRSEETSLWSGTPGHISRINTYMLCVLLSPLVLPLLYAFWVYLTVRCCQIVITTRRVMIRSGVLNKTTDEIELYRVKDVRALEPFAYRMFDRGSLVLMSSDRTTPEFRIEAIPDIHTIRNTVSEQVQICREAKGVREID